MRYLPHFRAALLTLLVFATSLSASICDASCFLPTACSHCCSSGLNMSSHANMAMPPDMTMPRTVMSATDMSNMSAYANVAMAQESSTNVRMPDSISLSSCAGQTCRQAWDASSSWTLSRHPLPQDAANAPFSIRANLLIRLHRPGKQITASQPSALAPISPLRI